MERAPLFAEGCGDLRLAGGIGELGTDGHIAELGIEHLFLGVGESVLLAGGLVAHEDIDEDQHDDEADEGVLLTDGFASQNITI